MADSHRPRHHLTAPTGWLNDPNGMCHRDGTYHLFYQANPDAPVHDRIQWAHATSEDLVRWSHAPPALVPDDDGPDRDGCWSGVLVDDDGVPTIVYSGRAGGRELPCVATGTPDLLTWTKDPANPVVAGPPPGVDVVAFRDHCVWREDGRWRQLVGSGVRGVGGTAFLYDSDDLRRWTYVGPLATGSSGSPARGEPLWSGTMWECVDLFRLCEDGTSAPVGDPAARSRPGVDVLVLSVWDDEVTHHPLAFTGQYEGDRFDVHATHPLDLGRRYFYAPQSMADAAGRRVQVGWLQEGRDPDHVLAAGWSGAMSLPRVLTLHADGGLVAAPAAEVAGLRTSHTPVPPAVLGIGEDVVLPVAGDCVDLELSLRLAPGAVARLRLRASPDGVERTDLLVERLGDGLLRVALDRSASSLATGVDREPLGGDVPDRSAPDGTVAVRAVVDRSALEVFVDGVPLTARVYPTRPDAVAALVGSTRGTVGLLGGDAWLLA